MNKKTKNKLVSAVTIIYSILGLVAFMFVGYTEGALTLIYAVLYGMWAREK